MISLSEVENVFSDITWRGYWIFSIQANNEWIKLKISMIVLYQNEQCELVRVFTITLWNRHLSVNHFPIKQFDWISCMLEIVSFKFYYTSKSNWYFIFRIWQLFCWSLDIKCWAGRKLCSLSIKWSTFYKVVFAEIDIFTLTKATNSAD